MKRALVSILGCCSLLLFVPVAKAQVADDSDKLVTIEIDTDTHQLTVVENGKPRKWYPVGLGKAHTPSPVGNWTVTSKHTNWGGGFGTRWIGLDVPWGIYGIHGTNNPASIGRDASSGCVRMRNRDVEQLYKWVSVGTPVRILGDPLGPMRRLAKGDIGADVQLVQDRLRRLGYYHGACDGRFGGTTETALKEFERIRRLPVDGVVSIHDYHSLGLIE